MKGHKTVKTATKNTTVVHAFKEHDPVARINFCDWFLQPVHDGKTDPQLVFFFMRLGFPHVER
jgi:hypothetical protein